MRITEITARNFRCFDNLNVPITKRVILIEGDNGTGKTSLLELLHYSCYLRSFRTHLGRELIAFDQDHFFLHVRFMQEHFSSMHDVRVGFRDGSKQVTFDQTSLTSHKELVEQFRVVSLTEEDIALVKGAPEVRRLFLDHALILADTKMLTMLKAYKRLLQSRNALLAQSRTPSLQEWRTWTEKLWEVSKEIQKTRIDYVKALENEIHALLNAQKIGPELHITLTYRPYNMQLHEKFEDFWAIYEAKDKQSIEKRYGRTLFGAHLDDVHIGFNAHKARVFASRGQQKFVAFLLKMGQMRLLETTGKESCLLLDDFLTDFDPTRLGWSIGLLQEISGQIFIACPLKSYLVQELKRWFEIQTIEL